MLPEGATEAARAAVTQAVNCSKKGTSTPLNSDANAVLSSVLPLWVLKHQTCILIYNYMYQLSLSEVLKKIVSFTAFT